MSYGDNDGMGPEGAGSAGSAGAGDSADFGFVGASGSTGFGSASAAGAGQSAGRGDGFDESPDLGNAFDQFDAGDEPDQDDMLGQAGLLGQPSGPSGRSGQRHGRHGQHSQAGVAARASRESQAQSTSNQQGQAATATMTMDASADEPGHSIYSSHSDYRPTDGNDVPATKHSAFWKALGIVAELLFTLAAICALYVVWQMWWTGVESEHNQIEQRQSVGWSDPSSAKHGTKVAPAQNGAPPVQPRQASSGDLIAQIYIPRFGNQWQRNIVEGTDMPQLNEHGVGHYTQSQMPGQVGNFAVAGHRNGYGQPFGDVDKLDAKAGDTIIVRTKDYWYVYQYTSYEVVTPDQVRVIAPNPQNPSAAPTQRLITLTTCEPKYSTPTHRWISYGKLKYWAKVSDGIPQELAKQGANGKVQFINNGKTSPVAKLSSLIPLIVALLVIYLVLFIAAAIVWRWPLRKAIRLGEHKKPEPSIYGGLTRLQPGIKPLRVLLVLLLIAVAALALFQWAFPWAAQNIPILHQMSNYVAVQQ